MTTDIELQKDIVDEPHVAWAAPGVHEVKDELVWRADVHQIRD
jgi:hypothetical protein